VGIEIGEEAAYLFLERRRGFGGFPYGSAGRLVSLISGGIDSPVATFLMMKRGVAPILVHFQIWPEDEGESGKLLALKRHLEEYAAGREIPLHLIPRDELFAGRFAEIYESRFQPYVCLLCKYLMHRRAQEIAESAGALGLITGDNLAQVASQTLANLHAQRHWNRLPVYSPLIAYEKNETMALARLIGTYDLSIGSERGCRAPASPKTAVSPERLERILRETGLWKEPPQST
jgi:thiamine biosynthesis protein ThiI